MTHNIKILPPYYWRMKSGQKTFELRKNDRDYQVGDRLVLHYFDPENPREEAREIDFAPPIELYVTYILHGGQFGIEPGYCVMQTSQNPLII